MKRNKMIVIYEYNIIDYCYIKLAQKLGVIKKGLREQPFLHINNCSLF